MVENKFGLFKLFPQAPQDGENGFGVQGLVLFS
jgi:hypothetical protein